MMRLILAFLAAICVPACVGTAMYLYGQFMVFEPDAPYILIRTRTVMFACLAISMLHVVVLGIPGFLILRWRRALSWPSILLTGFVLGAIPGAILSWPLQYAGMQASAIHDGVATMIDGVPTLAGWLDYVGGVFVLGAYGVSGAAAFWLVQRRAAS